MFDGSIGTDKLSAKFSFYKIRKRTQALENEAQNEMWLTRPYLSKEETDFMENGVFRPRRSLEGAKGVVLDDNGGVIQKSNKTTGILKPYQIPKDLLPIKYQKSQKLKQQQSEIMNRKQLKPDVRGTDIWKSMEKYRTWERDDQVDLDFYKKYHNMAVPRAFPAAMPEAREKWFAWDRIPGFKTPETNTKTASASRADSIPHPLAYDTSISGEDSSSSHFTP